VHHFLSDIERNAFLIYDWAASVVDTLPRGSGRSSPISPTARPTRWRGSTISPHGAPAPTPPRLR
jgi:hypothetical protein